MTSGRRRWAALVPAIALLAVAAPAAAQESAGTLWQVFPGERLYRPYLADPLDERFGITVVGVGRVDVPDSGASRFGLHLGGELGLLRRERSALGPIQLGFIAGFRGQFDRAHSSDNIGWDGVYGLMLSARPRPGLAVRAGLHHTSAHLGDEYMERTGRQRVGYTREEALVGVSVDRGAWRVYGEAGWSFEDRTGFQEPLRLQAGLEHRASLHDLLGVAGSAGERFGWYAALDATSYEERDWSVDAGVATGLLLLTADRVWRVGVAVHDGRVPMGELAQYDEQWVEVGLWLDL